MLELKIVWRNPDSQLRVAPRRIQRCELSPEFYDVQELVPSGNLGLWLTPAPSRFTLRVLRPSQQTEVNRESDMTPLPPSDPLIH